jgi:hypothetical protein
VLYLFAGVEYEVLDRPLGVNPKTPGIIVFRVTAR